MKTRMVLLLCASLFLLALIQVGGWAQQKYQPKANEELYGTWINDKDFNMNGFQKVVMGADGMKLHSNALDVAPLDEATEQIDSKWIDSDGNIWYKTFGETTGGHSKGEKLRSIVKLSKSATVMEINFRPTDADYKNQPTTIDTSSSEYGIYYRSAK